MTSASLHQGQSSVMTWTVVAVAVVVAVGIGLLVFRTGISGVSEFVINGTQKANGFFAQLFSGGSDNGNNEDGSSNSNDGSCSVSIKGQALKGGSVQVEVPHSFSDISEATVTCDTEEEVEPTCTADVCTATCSIPQEYDNAVYSVTATVNNKDCGSADVGVSRNAPAID